MDAYLLRTAGTNGGFFLGEDFSMAEVLNGPFIVRRMATVPAITGKYNPSPPSILAVHTYHTSMHKEYKPHAATIQRSAFALKSSYPVNILFGYWCCGHTTRAFNYDWRSS
eukprot:4075566-Pyramimonas_sp.AAC.2